MSHEALETKATKRRGRALVCKRDVAAGEVVLSEDPLLLVVSSEQHDVVCSWCLRLLSGPFSCADCEQASFCSPACQQAATATPWGHSPAVCRAYKACSTLQLGDEDHTTLRFLVHCCAMKQAHPPGSGGPYERLLAELQGSLSPAIASLAPRMHQLLSSITGGAAGVTVEEVAALVARERANSYGVLAPSDDDGERQLRGSGIYLRASMINHECIPNVARFDFYDSLRPDNTRIEFRAMHALPAGTEVVQSYFPLNWDLQERQQQCQDVYGFTCRCPRCQTESAPGYGAHDEDMADGDAGAGTSCAHDAAGSGTSGMTGAAASSSQGEEGEEGEEGPLEETYLQLFLLKYVCPQEACFGTMAPLTGARDVLECNVCGGRRTEAQFLAELESG